MREYRKQQYAKTYKNRQTNRRRERKPEEGKKCKSMIIRNKNASLGKFSNEL